MVDQADQDELLQQAERIRESGLLGKPGALSRLFDYLLERSLAADVPKEIEIALQVFGKTTTFDVSQDSVVRVYVHKLRKRLDDFYSRSSPPAVSRIVIPKGEYRLAVERLTSDTPGAVDEESPLPSQAPQSTRSPWRRRWIAVSALLAATALGALIAIMAVTDQADWDMRALRNSAVWAPLLDDDLPVIIVLGDYYMLGEADEQGNVKRLVREFSINSPGDFMNQVEASPELMARYRNLNLTYLPTSSAFALQNIVPLLSRKKRVRVVLMSEMKGDMLRGAHIVYVGYVSGLGMLGGPVFNASRMMPGTTYDVLIDTATSDEYHSSAGDIGESRYTDYGYFSTFPGPDRNRVVIIAGTRDTGVMAIADTVVRPEALGDMSKKVGGAASFESLYEVYGVGKGRMNAKQVLIAPLTTAHIWE